MSNEIPFFFYTTTSTSNGEVVVVIRRVSSQFSKRESRDKRIPNSKGHFSTKGKRMQKPSTLFSIECLQVRNISFQTCLLKGFQYSSKCKDIF